MHIQEITTWIQKIVPIIHAHHHDHDPDKTKLFHLVKISEEVGELAEQVLWSCKAQRDEKNDKISPDNLAKEACDVIISTLVLMHSQQIDIEQALSNRMEHIKERMHIQ